MCLVNNLAGAAILSALTSPNQPIGKETGFNTSELVGFLNMRMLEIIC
jgi:hypothetical protein